MLYEAVQILQNHQIEFPKHLAALDRASKFIYEIRTVSRGR